MFVGNLSETDKLQLLLWKYWKRQIADWRSLLMCTLTPLLFFLLLIFTRMMCPVENVPMRNYSHVDLTQSWFKLTNKLATRKLKLNKIHPNFTYNPYIPRLTVGYAPRSYEGFNKIIKQAQLYLNITELISFDSCEELRHTVGEQFYLAGVCFNNVTMDNNTLYMIDGIYPKHLDYSLIFPSELRNYEDIIIGSNWKTNQLTTYERKFFKTTNTDNDGGYVGYIREGFIPLQNAIAMSFIRLVSKGPDIELNMKRFPKPGYINDEFINSIWNALPTAFILSYIYPVLYFTRTVVFEQQYRLRALMNTLLVNDFLQSIALFIYGCLLFNVSSLLTVFTIMLPWHHGHSFLTHSSWIAVFIFVFAYNLATVCLCLMIASFFKTPIHAVIFAGFFWYMTCWPYVNSSEELANNHLAILSNIISAYGFDLIMKFEVYGLGFQLRSFYDSQTLSDENTTVLHIVIIFVVQAILYFGISLVVLVFQTDFRFTSLMFWQKFSPREAQISAVYSRDSAKSHIRHTKIYEVESDERCLLKVTNLTKKWDKSVVFSDVNFSLYENEITVLLGHNASGKSTLLSILAGIHTYEEGKIQICDYNLKTQSIQALAQIGIFLRDIKLCRQLCVEDQLTFFCRIRGVHVDITPFEVLKYINALNLQRYSKTKTSELPRNIRQLLYVSCALIGGTKVVLLDEPGAGLPHDKQALLWKLLEADKKYRTILLTTHSLFETKVLADRLAILADGELKLCGNSYFLRNVYGKEYQLTCIKLPHAENDPILELIHQYIPGISPGSRTDREITFSLQEKHFNVLHDLVTEFEERANELNLTNFQLLENFTNNIFFKMAAYGSALPNVPSTKRGRNTFRREEIAPLISLLSKRNPPSRRRMILNHWRVLLKKQFIFYYRSLTLILLLIVIPIVMVIFCVVITNISMSSKKMLSNITFSLTQYTKTSSTIEKRKGIDDSMQSISKWYEEEIFWIGGGHQTLHTNNQSFEDFILHHRSLASDRINTHFMSGLTLAPNDIIVWFNNFHLHTAPLSLMMAHTAILRSIVGPDAKISVQFNPLPLYDQLHTQSQYDMNTTVVMTLDISFAIYFILSIGIVFMIKEHTSHFKQFQHLAGVSKFTYWMARFAYDFIHTLFFSVLVVSMLLIYYSTGPIGPYSALICFFMSCLYGVTCSCMSYILSFVFSDPLDAYSVLAVYDTLGISTLIVIQELEVNMMDFVNTTMKVLEWFKYVFPPFAYCSALKDVLNAHMEKGSCKKAIRMISMDLENCEGLPNCCHADNIQLLSWDYGIYPETTGLVIILVLSIIILIIIECRSKPHIESNYESRDVYYRAHTDRTEQLISDTVIEEKLRVEMLAKNNYINRPLICKNVTTDTAKPLQNFYLMMDRGERLGFLGSTNSGTETLLNALIAHEPIVGGEIFVNGFDLEVHKGRAYKNIGFFPKLSSLLQSFSNFEILWMTCLLRGVPEHEISETIKISHFFNFVEYLDMPVIKTSHGIQARVALIAAMINGRSLCIINQELSNIDPAGRRACANILNQFTDLGNAILFTKMDGEICSKVCTRIAFISNAIMYDIGTPEEVSARFDDKYQINIRLKPDKGVYSSKSGAGGRRLTSKGSTKLEIFMSTKFPNSLLQNSWGKMFIYTVPRENTSIANIFNTIQQDSSRLNIEDIEISLFQPTIAFSKFLEQRGEP